MNAHQTKAGQLDPSFNGGNPLYLDLPGFWQDQRGMAAGRDGLIYIAGNKAPYFGGPADFYIGALDAQGRWSPGFGSDGKLEGSFFDTQEPGVLVSNFTDALHYEQGLVADADRLFLLGRYIYRKDNGPQSVYPAVACFRIDGSLDLTFGTEGICIFAGLEGNSVLSFALPTLVDTTDSNGEAREAHSGSPMSWGIHDRRFYIVGTALGVPLTLLIVIDFSGAIDWNFGVNGVQKIGREPGFLAYDIFMGADGIYLSGISGAYPEDLTVATSARLDFNGALDTSYGENGFQDFGWESYKTYTVCIAPLATDCLVTAGFVRLTGSDAAILLSHDLDGNVNPDFNGGRPVFIGDEDGHWRSLAVEADAVIAIGRVEQAGILVARFLHDGQLDTSFADGAGWRVLTEVSPYAFGRHMIVRSDRSIVIWGGDTGGSVVTALIGK